MVVVLRIMWRDHIRKVLPSDTPYFGLFCILIALVDNSIIADGFLRYEGHESTRKSLGTLTLNPKPPKN
jgi:hypothetical protein